MNFYQFHIGDYAVHTRHLSLMEDLAYRRLLDLYYTHEGDIPVETQSVSRLIGMREHTVEVATVLAEFFTQDDSGRWHHARCDQEIGKAKAAAERARNNGKAGGRPASPGKEPEKNPPETQRVPSENPDESKLKAPNTQYPITKEEISEAKASSSAEPTETAATPIPKPAIPPCPHESLIDLYHEVLPELPRVRLKTADRQKALAKVWRWVQTSRKADGQRRAEDSAGGVEWFRLYFGQVRDNDFLMGRTPRSGTHANWACTLDYLLTDRGMKQVIERTYDNEAAA